jgi:hypothetical protein
VADIIFTPDLIKEFFANLAYITILTLRKTTTFTHINRIEITLLGRMKFQSQFKNTNQILVEDTPHTDDASLSILHTTISILSQSVDWGPNQNVQADILSKHPYS